MGKSPKKDGVLATLKHRPSKSLTVRTCQHFPHHSKKPGNAQPVASILNDTTAPKFALKEMRTVRSLAFKAVFSGMTL